MQNIVQSISNYNDCDYQIHTPNVEDFRMFKNKPFTKPIYENKVNQHTNFGFEDINVNVPNVSWGEIVNIPIPMYSIFHLKLFLSFK